MPQSFFKSVMPLEGARLHIEMCSGSTIILDLSDKLKTIRFCSLEDPDLFNSVAIDGDFIVFGEKVKIGASEVGRIAMIPCDME